MMDVLRATLPNWVQVVKAEDLQMEILATPLLPSGAPGRTYELVVYENAGTFAARERVPESTLPAHCPERHINGDGSFCLGLVPIASGSTSQARLFWTKLAAFLLCQHSCERSGRWPPGQWLSHGDAAVHQLRAESLAAEAGLSEEYRLALEYRQGWLAGRLPRTHRKSTRLVNGRAACPRGCKSRGRPILRLSCSKRHVIEELIATERARLAAEAEFFAALRKAGSRCCGRMPTCPLKEET